MKIEESLKTGSGLPTEKRTVISLFFTTSQAYSIINTALKPYDISEPQFNVLRILRGQKGTPVTLAEIQERMISKMSNTTRLIDKHIQKRYVKKVINSKNRRKVDISITSEGLDLLNKTDAVVLEAERHITSTLTDDEKNELIRLLGKIRLIAN